MVDQKMISLCKSVMFMTVLLGAVIALSVSQNDDSYEIGEARQFAVFFPFGSNHSENISAILNANGLPVRSGAFDFIMIASSEDENFTSKLKENGARFVTKPFFIGACVTQS